MQQIKGTPRRRLGLMTLFLAIAVGVTLLAEAQTRPGPTDDAPADAAPADNRADAPPATDSDASPAEAPPALDDQAPPRLSEQPIARFKDLFLFSPIINGIILGLSVLGLLFFLYFMAAINRRTFAPPRFVDEVVKLIVRGDLERAGDACRRARGVFAAPIVQRCIENERQAHSLMLHLIDTEGRRQADIVWNRVSYLADISNVAPMLGLLGTVLGMIKAFYGLEHESGGMDAVVLSRGVGEAMSTTLFGLGVGIFTLVLYSLVKARATRTLADAEQAVHMIADHLKRDEASATDTRE